jgi:hypothetical protein
MLRLVAPLCAALALGCAGSPANMIMDGPADAGADAEPPRSDARPDSPAPRDTRVDAAPTLDDACVELAAHACDRMNACEPFVLKQRFGSTVTCAARLRIACMAAAGAPGARATVPALTQCARALDTAACGDVVSGAAVAACFPAGSRADSQPCGINTQCASGYCQLKGARCGMCRPRAAASASCDPQEDGQCQRGLVCTGTCVKPGAVGAACTDARPCQALLRCGAGVCVVPSPAGAPCAGDECNDLIGLACIKPAGASRGTCQAMKLVAAGERCGMVSTAIAVCSTSATCGSDSRCVAPAADGQPCAGCLYPAVCADGACRVPASTACN